MLKAVQDTVDRVTESDARLMKNVAVTHRIGFADVILPGFNFFTLCCVTIFSIYLFRLLNVAYLGC